MLKKSESHYLIFTLAELICLGCAWMQYDWVLYFLLVLLLAQLAYSINREIRRRSGTKICPLCKMHVVIWYRICPNCGYIFVPGCKKDELTEMIEDALDKEEIHDFDGEYPTERVEQIELEAVEKYINNP